MQATHPLNVINYCLKCGSRKFHQSGERSLKCDQCGFHFFINSAAAVAAIVANEDGKLLLTTRAVEPDSGKLDLPGGFIDPGETAEDAVRRELQEELSMKVKSLEYVGSAPNEYVFSGYSVFTLDMAFRVVPEFVGGMVAMDDILDFQFYAEDEIDYTQIPAPSIKSFVKQYFSR